MCGSLHLVAFHCHSRHQESRWPFAGASENAAFETLEPLASRNVGIRFKAMLQFKKIRVIYSILTVSLYEVIQNAPLRRQLDLGDER
jgi:hypothetical protein